MKKIFFIVSFFVVIIACKDENKQQQKPIEMDKLAKISVDTANFTDLQLLDSISTFGEIKEGEKVEVTFKFKNVGTKNLYVTEVTPGCGCTTSDYSKEAIAPQKEGWIKGIYNSKNGHGEVHKSITFRANTIKGYYQLKFTGFVKN